MPLLLDSDSDSDAGAAALTATLDAGLQIDDGSELDAFSAQSLSRSSSDHGGQEEGQRARSSTAHAAIVTDSSSDERASTAHTATAVSPQGWAVGLNCGPHVHHRSAPLGIQGQVLLGNLVWWLMSLPAAALQYLGGLSRASRWTLRGHSLGLARIVCRLSG